MARRSSPPAAARRREEAPTPPREAPCPLAALGIHGWKELAPVVVAALATETPVLLVGPHGTAKTLLLNRLAAALGLRHRHYNASLLNFDDLVGFPVPSEDRSRLVYVPTASSIWDAESVLFDEVSRCRVDLQNKLFPLVHERVVQGLPLPSLRFRWAAMNPPAVPGSDEADDALAAYRGSEPLDPALADRFTFVVAVPGLGDLSPAERLAVITGTPPADETGPGLQALVELAHRHLDAVRAQLSLPVARWVEALLPRLEAMRRPVSPRRARALHDAALAVHAARFYMDAAASPGDSAWLALRCGLPHPATGQPLDGAALLAAHRQAWALAAMDEYDPVRLVLSEPDPVQRVAVGLRAGLPGPELSALVLDAWAGLPPPRRVAFAAALFPRVASGVDLSAAAFETLATVQAALEDARPRNHALVPGSPRFELWRKLTHHLAGLPRDTVASRTAHNVLLVAFERDEGPFEPVELAAWFDQVRAAVGGTGTEP